MTSQLSISINVTVIYYVVFKQLDEDIINNTKRDNVDDGACCLAGLIMNGALTIANIGDSVATLVKTDGSWQQLNVEHRPTSGSEYERCKLSLLRGARI